MNAVLTVEGALELVSAVGLAIGLLAIVYYYAERAAHRRPGTVWALVLASGYLLGVPADVYHGDWIGLTLRLFVAGVCLALIVFDAAKRAQSIRRHPSNDRGRRPANLVTPSTSDATSTSKGRSSGAPE